MGNKETLQQNNSKLNTNNNDLSSILNTINNLPSSGEGGKVNDVLVDGISVVDNKIANIQLKQSVINILIEYGLIQNGELNNNQVADIEQLIVSYFENKTVLEVEE